MVEFMKETILETTYGANEPHGWRQQRVLVAKWSVEFKKNNKNKDML